jgi:hypothetical protein
MRTPPTPPTDPIDRLRAETRARIDRFGFTKLIVGTGECTVPGCDCEPEPHSYTYTLGMCDHGSREFVTFGLSMLQANSVVDTVCENVIRGRGVPIGRDHRVRLAGGPTVSFVAVPDRWVEVDADRVGSWFDLYAPRFPTFVQVCWSDEAGHMPWEPGCNPAVAAVQPVLADDPVSIPRPVE